LTIVFDIAFIGSDENFSKIRPFLPPVPELHVDVIPPDRLVYLLTHSPKPLRLIVWSSPRILGMVDRLIQDQEDVLDIHDIICTGSTINVAEALLIGRLGIETLFDLPDAGQQLTAHITDWYGTWNQSIDKEVPRKSLEDILVGQCSEIRKMRELIRKIAGKERLTVLVRGETGSGKGLVARMIHKIGNRNTKPLVEINCSAIPDTLMEAELFGHEKGAFTDAHRTRRGIFELAHGGTLFLDEIGYLKSEMQVKLLKILEDKSFRRIGSEQTRTVDCRIITGTSIDMEKAIKTGDFRSDLYYRLNVFPVWVPPLRNRGQDILMLANNFRELYSAEYEIPSPGFTQEAEDQLLHHVWPGNVRELKHTIERAVILCEGAPISVDDLDVLHPVKFESRSSAENQILVDIPPGGKSMEDIQGEIVARILEISGGNRSKAARMLKISRSRLLRKLNNE
jgi:DNA-binding NtrC family response regulator